MLINVLLVALGGAAGSAGRFLVGEGVKRAVGAEFPYGTLVVNVVGCAAIGFLIPFWTGSHPAHLNARLLVVTGVLGGFTTFSAFGVETHKMFASGQTTWALANIALNVVVGLGAVGVGVRLGRVLSS